jgi:hypothetical protein
MTSPAGGDPLSTSSPPDHPLPPSSRPTGRASLPSAASFTSGTWPADTADRIVDLVDTVRDKTTGPAQTGARSVVYGLLAALVGIVVLVLVIIGAVRGLDILVDRFISWGHIWLPYLILGVVFMVAGALVFRRRRTA